MGLGLSLWWILLWEDTFEGSIVWTREHPLEGDSKFLLNLLVAS